MSEKFSRDKRPVGEEKFERLFAGLSLENKAAYEYMLEDEKHEVRRLAGCLPMTEKEPVFKALSSVVTLEEAIRTVIKRRGR